jgi:hypothetical protein
MTASEIPSLRRRPIPGMTANHAAQSDPPVEQPDPPAVPEPVSAAATAAEAPVSSSGTASRRRRPDRPDDRPRAAAPSGRGLDRRSASDYATTRLVNFRLPADLHDRYKQLVRETEDRHPRLRHPSLTEVVIALLEEGPSTPEEIADLIRRKRAAEYGTEA